MSVNNLNEILLLNQLEETSQTDDLNTDIQNYENWVNNPPAQNAADWNAWIQQKNEIQAKLSADYQTAAAQQPWSSTQDAYLKNILDQASAVASKYWQAASTFYWGVPGVTGQDVQNNACDNFVWQTLQPTYQAYDNEQWSQPTDYKAEIDGDWTTAQNDITDLQNQIKALQTDVSTDQEQIASLQSKINALQSEVNALSPTDPSYAKAIQDMNTLSKAMTTLQNDLNGSTQQIQSLNGQVTALTSSTAYTDLQALASEMNPSATDAAKAVADLSTITQASKAIGEDISTAQSLYSSDLQAVNTGIANVTNDLPNYKAEIDTDWTTAQGEIANLQNQIAALQTDVSTDQEQIASLQSKINTLQSEVNALSPTDPSYAKAIQDMNALSKAMTTLQNDLNGSTQQIQTLNGELTALTNSTAYTDLQALANEVNPSATDAAKAAADLSTITQASKAVGGDISAAQSLYSSDLQAVNTGIANVVQDLITPPTPGTIQNGVWYPNWGETSAGFNIPSGVNTVNLFGSNPNFDDPDASWWITGTSGGNDEAAFLKKYFAENPDGQANLTIGGQYSFPTLTPSNISTYAESIIEHCKQYGYSGVDFDYEGGDPTQAALVGKLMATIYQDDPNLQISLCSLAGYTNNLDPTVYSGEAITKTIIENAKLPPNPNNPNQPQYALDHLNIMFYSQGAKGKEDFTNQQIEGWCGQGANDGWGQYIQSLGLPPSALSMGIGVDQGPVDGAALAQYAAQHGYSTMIWDTGVAQDSTFEQTIYNAYQEAALTPDQQAAQQIYSQSQAADQGVTVPDISTLESEIATLREQLSALQGKIAGSSNPQQAEADYNAADQQLKALENLKASMDEISGQAGTVSTEYQAIVNAYKAVMNAAPGSDQDLALKALQNLTTPTTQGSFNGDLSTLKLSIENLNTAIQGYTSIDDAITAASSAVQTVSNDVNPQPVNVNGQSAYLDLITIKNQNLTSAQVQQIISDLKSSGVTQVNLSFAQVGDESDWEVGGDTLFKEVIADVHNEGMKANLSFGGEANSNWNITNPSQLANDLSKFVKQNKIDGLDFDYEPVSNSPDTNLLPFLQQLHTNLQGSNVPMTLTVEGSPYNSVGARNWTPEGSVYSGGVLNDVFQKFDSCLDGLKLMMYTGSSPYLSADDLSAWIGNKNDSSVPNVAQEYGIPLDKIQVGFMDFPGSGGGYSGSGSDGSNAADTYLNALTSLGYEPSDLGSTFWWPQESQGDYTTSVQEMDQEIKDWNQEMNERTSKQLSSQILVSGPI